MRGSSWLHSFCNSRFRAHGVHASGRTVKAVQRGLPHRNYALQLLEIPFFGMFFTGEETLRPDLRFQPGMCLPVLPISSRLQAVRFCWFGQFDSMSVLQKTFIAMSVAMIPSAAVSQVVGNAEMGLQYAIEACRL